MRQVNRELTEHETAESIIDKVCTNHPEAQAVGTGRLGVRSTERLAPLGALKAEAARRDQPRPRQLRGGRRSDYGKHNVSPSDIIVSRSGGYTPVITQTRRAPPSRPATPGPRPFAWSKITKVIEPEKFTSW